MLASVLQAASPEFSGPPQFRGSYAADAKVDPGAPASGSPKVVEGEVVKPPPS